MVVGASQESWRYHIHISYTPRWIRPTGYIQHEPELLTASSPIRRQLLGANGDNSDPLENDGSQGGDIGQSVAGQHWFPSDFEKVGCLLLTQRFSPAGPARGYHLSDLMKKGTQVVRR